MRIEATKKGTKEFRFEDPSIQVGGGVEDTFMQPCETRGCGNRFESVFPEPGEVQTVFCPDCVADREFEMDRYDEYDFDPYF